MHTSNTAITPNILFFIMLLFLLIIALHTATFYNIFTRLTTIILLFIRFFVKVKISFNVSKGDYDMSDTKETESYTTVELTLDNDEIIECAILTVYEAAGKEYIALLPLDENLEPNEAGDVYLYQYNETEDGEPDLGNIEDDDEYEIAADAFDEWMDSQEFDESDVEE